MAAAFHLLYQAPFGHLAVACSCQDVGDRRVNVDQVAVVNTHRSLEGRTRRALNRRLLALVRQLAVQYQRYPGSLSWGA